MSAKKLSFNGFSAFALLMCITFGAIKMRTYVSEGRFWAEEGTFFYSNMLNLPIWERPFFLFNGHLEFITNIIVTLATLVDVEYAPLLTTHLAYAAQLIPIYIIIKNREALGLSEWKVISLIIISVGIPQASEVWANTTNLHFHFALAAGLIASLPPAEGLGKHFQRLMLLASGLSGIPANFILPVFILNATREQTRERWIQMGIMLTTTILQVGLLLTNSFEHTGRTYSFNPLIHWLASLSQSITTPLLGLEIGHHISQILRSAYELNIDSLLFAAALSILPAYLILAVTHQPNRTHKSLLACAAISLILCITTSLGSKTSLISSFYGGRYFYASNIFLTICLLGSIKKHHHAAIALACITTLASIKNIPHFLDGPSWQDSLTKAKALDASQVEIWPQGWTMHLPDGAN